MGVAKVMFQQEINKAVGQGLLPAVPLPCLHGVAASLWDPERCPAGFASMQPGCWGDDSVIATTSLDTSPLRMLFGLSHRLY